MTTAAERFKASLAKYPPIPGTPKSPYWESLMTEVMIEILDRLEQLEIRTKD